MDITTLETNSSGDSRLLSYGVESGQNHFLTRRIERPDMHGVAPDVFLYQGIVQSPNDISARAIQQALFDTLPVASVTTVGNNGMGILGGRDYASREETAAIRLELLERTTSDIGALLVGISLGSQTINDMLLPTVRRTNVVAVNGICHIGPGLIDPLRAAEKTQRLPLNLAGTTTRFLLTHPFNLPMVGELFNIVNRTIRNQQPVDNQGAMVALGTPPEAIEEVAEYYPMDVTAGRDDVVFDEILWTGLENERTIRTKRLPGIGHELVFTPRLAVPAITESLGRLATLPNSLAA